MYSNIINFTDKNQNADENSGQTSGEGANSTREGRENILKLNVDQFRCFFFHSTDSATNDIQAKEG